MAEPDQISASRNELYSDGHAPRFPVSVKGVIFHGDRVVLLQNEREEWELPGGKLEPGEDPADCLVREIEEELSIPVEVTRIIDCWVYPILPALQVLIVTYGCQDAGGRTLQLSDEHKAIGLFRVEELGQLRMPEGYRRSIRRWDQERRR